jgi:hypothetical protein
MEFRVKSSKNYNLKSRSIAFGFLFGSVILGWVASLFITNTDYSYATIGLGFLLGILLSIRTKLEYNETFACKDCGAKIDSPAKNSGADNEAIIFICNECKVLWHTGNVCN